MGIQAVLVLATTIALGVSFIAPRFLGDQLLQHSPTVAALLVLAAGVRRKRLSDFAMVSAILFLALHILGARYVYSTVPYDAWTETVTGWSPDAAFGFERNHYDRFVHFAFGVLAVLFLDDVTRTSLSRRGPRLLIALLAVAGTGALYEVFEWGLSLTVSPELALRYNGQQGDVWDAQKDMALALAGALCAVPFAARRSPSNEQS